MQFPVMMPDTSGGTRSILLSYSPINITIAEVEQELKVNSNYGKKPILANFLCRFRSCDRA